MIDFKIYDEYKTAKKDGDNVALEELRRAYPGDYGLYEKIYQHERIHDYMDELKSQRKEEGMYQRWKYNHAHNIKSGKLPPEAAIPSFKLAGTLRFYDRFMMELQDEQKGFTDGV